MSTFARFIDDLTVVARKALAEPEMGNWFSATFNYGDYYYVGTATGWHCGCGADTRPTFAPWRGRSMADPF